MREYWKVALLSFALGVLAMSVYVSISRRTSIRAGYENWQKLNVALETVDKKYVDETDKKKVTDAALAAALQALDPHSVYMLPEPLKEADQDLSGGFEGVGLVFNVPCDTAVVLNVVSGGPSQKAGIATGDRIIKVNDIVIAGTSTPQDSMVRLMRGPKGTKVTLHIRRGSETIPFEIIRDKIPEHSVDASFMINDTTAYLRLSKFTRTTYQECCDALLKLEAMGMRRLIFDLRDNTGGLLDQVCNLANLFLDKDDMIVYTEGLHSPREELKANGKGAFKNVALSVLVNDASASASEIFAGAIQDNDRGVVVGRRSFGKGLVQESLYFNDGSGIRLTVARFYMPSGRCIQKPYDKDDYAYDLYKRYDSGELVCQDSIKIDSSKVYRTKGGRIVYGGGGIIPDIFVPLDTTKVGQFYTACTRKALPVRFAMDFYDKNKAEMSRMDNLTGLNAFITDAKIESAFLRFCAARGLVPAKGEWEKYRCYLLPFIKGLCARYTPMGEEGFSRMMLDSDDIIVAALKNPSRVIVGDSL